jgi:hypothetical protein
LGVQKKKIALCSKRLGAMANAFSFLSPSTSLFRNDELVKLKGADIIWDRISETGRPFFTITLTFRKTNQSDGNKGNRLSDFLCFCVTDWLLVLTY